MAISKPPAAAALAAVLALVGCGGAGGGGGARSAAAAHAPAGASGAASFAWLRPAAAPPGWSVATLPAGGAVAFPPGWRRIRSDPGTVTVAAFDRRGHFTGYLNLTPRQGAETARDWARFRVEHNAEEHERDVATVAAATALRFRTGRGSCVRDDYTTATGARFVEVACLVDGRRASVVVVGATPPRLWQQMAAVLERAISSVTA